MFRWFEVDELPQSRIFTDLKVCFNYNNPLLFRSFEWPLLLCCVYSWDRATTLELLHLAPCTEEHTEALPLLTEVFY